MLHQLFPSLPNPDALFVAAFSAILGALLAGAIRYGATRRERRISVTIELHAEFHTPVFAEMRIRAHAALTREGGGVAAVYPRVDIAEKQAIYAVLHYFERVALLARCGVIERNLLRRFLRQYVGWWRPLLCGESDAPRDDPEWGETLGEIDWLFQRIGPTEKRRRR